MARTRVCSCFSQDSPQLQKVWGGHGGRCSKSGESHIVLSGSQPHPAKFAEAASAAMIDAANVIEDYSFRLRFGCWFFSLVCVVSAFGQLLFMTMDGGEVGISWVFFRWFCFWCSDTTRLWYACRCLLFRINHPLAAVRWCMMEVLWTGFMHG